MSAYVVDAACIDIICSAARQYGGQEGFSWARLFPGVQPQAGYSYHRYSNYATDDEAPDRFNPNTLGRELWMENLRSIHHRYPDTLEGGTVPGPGEFSEADVLRYEYGPGSGVHDVDPLGALGAIRGYRYQACEHPGWHHSVAEAATVAIEGRIIGWMIDQTGTNAWSIDPEDVEYVTGETRAEPTPDGWTMRFTRGPSAAVSLIELMVRGR